MNENLDKKLEEKYVFRIGWHRYWLTVFPILYTISSILLYDPTKTGITLPLRIFIILFCIVALSLSYMNEKIKRNIEYFTYILIFLITINTTLTACENPNAVTLIIYGTVIMLCTYVYASVWYMRFYFFLAILCTAYLGYYYYTNQIVLVPMTLKGAIAITGVEITLFIHAYMFFQEKSEKDKEWISEIQHRKKIQKEKDKISEIYHIVTENIPVELALFKIENVSDIFIDNITYDYINQQYEPNIEKRNLLLNKNEVILTRDSQYNKDELFNILRRLEKIEIAVQTNTKIDFIEVKKYKNGDERRIERNIIPIFKENRPVNYALFTGIDITEEARMKDKILWEATHDFLTSLFNKRNIIKIIKKKIKSKEIFGVCFLDLDNFKGINDTLGHDVGDSLLIQLSARLKDIFREDDIGRLGGDEFLVVTNNVKSEQQIENFRNKFLSIFSEPFILKGKEYNIKSSSGLSIYPNHIIGDFDEAETTSLLLKYADIALYRSKENGKGKLTVYKKLDS